MLYITIYYMTLELDKRHKIHERDSHIISFITRENEDNGFYELLLNKIPIRSAGQHKYIVDSRGLQVLKSKHIQYALIKN